jgi:hypothetical protein
MPDNIPIVLWILIVFAVSNCVPSGVSYRELQAVAFYDRSYPSDVETVPNADGSNRTNPRRSRRVKGWFMRRLHDYFFSGTLASSIFASMFVAWVLFWYYHQNTVWYDVIMAMSTLFFGLLKGLPWVFVVTDDNYHDRLWFTMAKLQTSNQQHKAIYTETLDTSSVRWAKRLLFFYALLVTVVAIIILILLTVNKNNIEGWTFYVSAAFYALCVALMLLVDWFFYDVLYSADKPEKKTPKTAIVNPV